MQWGQGSGPKTQKPLSDHGTGREGLSATQRNQQGWEEQAGGEQGA